MSEKDEIEAIERLMHAARTLDFNDPNALSDLQADRDKAAVKGLVERDASMKILLILMERLQAGNGDEAFEKMYGTKVNRNSES